MMPAGSRVCRLIGELLSTGRTPGHVWSLDWERRSESGGSGNSRSTCSVGMRSSTRGSAGAAPSTADVLCGNVVIHAWRSRDLRREVLRPLQCWGQAAGMQGRRDRTPGHHLLPLRSSSSLEKGMHVPTSPTFLEGNTIV